MSKFKVGDRVRTTERLDKVPAGTRGVVTSLGVYVHVSFVEYSHDTEYPGWPYRERELELELIEDEPQPYDTPSPEADALDRIADLITNDLRDQRCIERIAEILLETGRL